MKISISTHRESLEREGIALVRRWSTKHPTDYPYRSSGQPFLAYAALAGCIFVLAVANSAALWDGFHVMPFLSSYLIVRPSYPLSFFSLRNVD